MSAIVPSADGNPVCYYCKKYGELIPDYPLNMALATDYHDLTPRCYLHSQFECHTCITSRHFNGISWCSSCRQFNCVHCSSHKVMKDNFLYYDYYYSITCNSCQQASPALDFAEYSLTHPYQTGEIQPEVPVTVWVPFEKPVIKNESIGAISGKQRVADMGYPLKYERLDNLNQYNSKGVWNEHSKQWVQTWDEEGDYHHKYIIIPELLRLMGFADPLEHPLKTLDIGCGSGNIPRKLAKAGYQVTGIDVSDKMLEHAKQKEQQKPLGIEYHLLSATELSSKFSTESFDLAYANMSLMDMEGYDTVVEQVFQLLKPGSLFVFSVTHPTFTWPISRTIKLPNDSERNEDRSYMVDNYFDTRPALLTWPNNVQPPQLYFPKTVSHYLNTLINNGFELVEVSEKEVDEEMAKQNPRQSYNDHTRLPPFMFFKCRKKI